MGREKVIKGQLPLAAKFLTFLGCAEGQEEGSGPEVGKGVGRVGQASGAT